MWSCGWEKNGLKKKKSQKKKQKKSLWIDKPDSNCNLKRVGNQQQ